MRDEGLYLDDLLEAADSIQRFVSGLKEEDFLNNDLVKSAVIQKLGVIGEAAAHISDQTKIKYPKIKWKSMKGLRNIAVHAYFSINWNTVWKTVQTEIGLLKAEIAEIIRADFPFPNTTEPQ